MARSPRDEARREWLEDVGKLTGEHRKRRAAKFRDSGHAREAELRAEGYSRDYAHDATKWYRDRTRGQRERIERVERCGSTVVRVTCASCGRTRERPDGCRVALLCVRCRSLVAQEKRAQFLRARSTLLEQAEQRGLLRTSRPGGRWSEKMLTLTAPQLAEHSIGDRIALLLEAWAHFRRRMHRHFRTFNAHRSTHWYRCLEWTLGADDKGHPHLHVWLFSPFIDHATQVVPWWRASLLEVGYPQAQLGTLIVHLGELRGGEAAAQELIKYMTKDIDENGEQVPPELYAQVYVALDSRRTTQCSRGLMKLAERDQRCECGACAWDRQVLLTEDAGETP